jgi:hypothetical protein
MGCVGLGFQQQREDRFLRMQAGLGHRDLMGALIDHFPVFSSSLGSFEGVV